MNEENKEAYINEPYTYEPIPVKSAAIIELETRIAILEEEIAAIKKWEVTVHPASKEYILNKKG